MRPVAKHPLSQALAVLCMAGAATSVTAQNVDLGNLGARGFRIDGADVSDQSGHSVSGAGDVNGDGLADFIMGSDGADGSAGESHVVFGKTGLAAIDLANLGSGGFRIDGVAGTLSGRSVSGAGDVNGDGLHDLIVGAYRASPGGDVFAGQSYVVFGKNDNTAVDVNSLGNAGFRIDGIDLLDNSGFSVSGAGDVNGDGRADLIIGAFRASPGGDSNAGESYVLFGKTGGAAVDLGALTGGFIINGIDPGDNSGRSVSGAGDVNGDGLADVIIGAHRGSPPGAGYAGESHVVFGKTNIMAVELGALGAGGFRIDGIDANDNSGISVSGAGDVNGDGLADLIVGAYSADPGGDSSAGESYVVFGKTDNIAVGLGSLGTQGFRIDGIDADDLSGSSVSGAGDVNGDGLADLIVGAPGAAPNGDRSAGETYVVFGKSSSAMVDLDNLGTGGFRMDGIDEDDFSGASVSGAGDVNGDGLSDVIVGAFRADPGEENAGESYVIFSNQTPPMSAVYRGHAANGNAPRLALGISGDGSNDGHPDSRAWIDFADGVAAAGAASNERVTLTQSDGGFSPSAATVSWQVESSRINWTSAEVKFRYVDSEITIGDEGHLRLMYSANGTAPFTPLNSVVNSLDNTISAVVTQLGFFYLGEFNPNLLFVDGFE
jgi:hypothetical protein